MAKFIVKGTVKYNGKVYTSGAVVDVDKKDVKEFKAHGWELVDEKEAEGGAPANKGGKGKGGNKGGKQPEGEADKQPEGEGEAEGGEDKKDEETK